MNIGDLVQQGNSSALYKVLDVNGNLIRVKTFFGQEEVFEKSGFRPASKYQVRTRITQLVDELTFLNYSGLT